MNGLFIRLKGSCVCYLGLYLALYNRESSNTRGFVKIDLNSPIHKRSLPTDNIELVWQSCGHQETKLHLRFCTLNLNMSPLGPC